MKRIALLWLALCAFAAQAQPIEIIALRFRSAEQVIPQLQPLLAPGGALTGTGGKLFVRTTPHNLADLRRVLAEIDREPRRLLISVRQGGDLQRDATGAGVSGDIAAGRNVRIYSSGDDGHRGGSVEIRNGETVIRGNAYEARTSGSENVAQKVQTIEGGRAFISVGQSVPVPVRRRVATPTGSVIEDSVEYRDVGSGFHVEPRVSGSRVTLDIDYANDRPTQRHGAGLPGSAETQRLGTTVSGRLGEWIELGGVRRETAEERGDIARYSTRSVHEERRIWLKVEQLP